MKLSDVRSEVERRKERAEELGIRETLFSLYFSHLCKYREWVRSDPEMIFPEFSKIDVNSEKQAQFFFGNSAFELTHKKEPVQRSEEEDTEFATLGLRVGGDRVFKFEIQRRTLYRREGPLTVERIGEITRFIEGPWVKELSELLEKIETYEAMIRKFRNAPQEAREIEQLRRRFGI